MRVNNIIIGYRYVIIRKSINSCSSSVHCLLMARLLLKICQKGSRYATITQHVVSDTILFLFMQTAPMAICSTFEEDDMGVIETACDVSFVKFPLVIGEE